MLTPARLPLLAICAFALGCDVLPKFQFQLQSKIQREFHVTSALVMIVDTTTMIVAIFDDAHAAFALKERAAFEEQVAYYAVTQFQPSKLKTVGIVVGRATRRGVVRDPEPTVFMPEYHTDGSVRLALMPSRRATVPPAQPKQ